MKTVVSTITLGVSCLFFLGGALSDWFAIPEVHAFGPEGLSTLSASRFQMLFQALALAAFCLSAYFIIKRDNIKVLSAAVVLTLVSGIVFVCLVMLWEPPLRLLATAIHTNAVYLNHETHLTFQWLQSDWMRNVNFHELHWTVDAFPLLRVPLAPLNVKLLDPVIGNALEYLAGFPIKAVQLSFIEDYLYGMGFNDVFFQFAKKGYFFTLFGGLLVFFAAALAAHEPISYLVGMLGTVFGVAVVTILLCSVPVFGALYLVDRADTQRAYGDYLGSIASLNKAVRILPVLEINRSFHEYRGELYVRTDQTNEPDYHFYLAMIRSEQGLAEEAIEEYKRAYDRSNKDNPLIRVVLANALLNEGIAYFNKGQLGAAKSKWREALSYTPGQLSASYYMSIAEIAQGNTEVSRANADSVLEVLSYYQMPFKAITSRAILIKAWSYFADGDYARALAYMNEANNAP